MFRTLLASALLTATAVGTAAPQTATAADDTPWTLPVTPPRCTTQQADSGDVADCLLAFYGDPADTGWGSPPAPGVGPGWSWLGYTYNGSPALADWEATRIGSNATAIAGKSAGYLETHVAAQTLFEGFLDEIAAGGYRVYGASGYSFRCTSGNGGWSCPSGDPGDLSLHAWGLAIDMNAGTNPIRSYTGIDGASACATPMQTDIPRWVVRTAEKWGLYWGGYGWNSGCRSPSTERSIVYRDPPHFEFRGTPEQAAAIAAFNLRDDPRATCFDVVATDGAREQRCTLSGVPQAGWRMPVHVDAPADAVAALVNLTAVDAPTDGSFTIEDCGPRPAGTRTTTSLQFAPGSAIANMAVAPLSADDEFCIWRSAAANSIVDVVGFVTSSGDRVWVDPTPPTRIVDTRRTETCTPDGTCRGGAIEADGTRRIPTPDTTLRLANVTTVDAEGRGYLQVGRCDGVGPDRTFSNMNVVDEPGARANLAVLDGAGSGACTYVYTGTHVVVDELARLDADTGYGWRLSDVGRAYDSDGRLPAGSLVEVDLGTDAPAAAVAITVSDPDDRGFATIARCDSFGPTRRRGAEPTTSNVNYVAGRAATNLALVETDGGRACFYLRASARVTIDVQAELVADRTLGLAAVTPHRVHDTRD